MIRRVRYALEAAGGDKKVAALSLGMTYSWLCRLVKRAGLLKQEGSGMK
jgi:hypothetical protein